MTYRGKRTLDIVLGGAAGGMIADSAVPVLEDGVRLRVSNRVNASTFKLAYGPIVLAARTMLFIWEGVTGYLTEAAVTAVLGWIATTEACTSPGRINRAFSSDFFGETMATRNGADLTSSAADNSAA